jgi:hypothetical protein
VGDEPPDIREVGGGRQLQQINRTQFPKLARPTFREAAYDQDTGLARTQGAPVTKLGKLVQVLLGAAQGAAAGASQPNFGAGFAAAQRFPFQLAGQRMALRQQQLESRKTEAEIGRIPFSVALDKARTEEAQSGVERNRSLARRRDFFNVPGVGLIQVGDDGQPTLVAGQPEKDTPEARKRFARANPELFPNEEERGDYIKFGSRRDPNDQLNKWGLRIRASQGEPIAKRALEDEFREESRLRAQGRARGEEESSIASSAESLVGKLLSRHGGRAESALDWLYVRMKDDDITPHQQRIISRAIGTLRKEIPAAVR